MRSFFVSIALAIHVCLVLATNRALADPEQTIRSADQTLHEIMAIPGKQIPGALLAEAQGVAIIPDVIKIGFIAGLRRGHGVVLVRGPDGAWSLPQFVTLTGGSVGWQAGVQGTDVVLVFMTRKSIEGLMSGKFTIGADASAAAGPVGRNAAAATDARLKAEILSYSRSRGLFAGIALDGSAIEIDAAEQMAYFGALPSQAPTRVPDSATKLLQDLTQITQLGHAAAIATGVPVAQEETTSPGALRQSLGQSASRLFAIVDEPWRKYLALPREVFEGNDPPQLSALRSALKQYDSVAQDPKYQGLASRAEFRSTHQMLRDYAGVLSEAQGPHLALPPPPPKR
jgi:lipid-binding SYLF domain-containing protein